MQMDLEMEQRALERGFDSDQDREEEVWWGMKRRAGCGKVTAYGS